MNKLWKAGVAVLILFIPAFIIGFLHLFGKNHFEVKTFYPKIDSASGQVLMSGKDTLFHKIPDFELIDQDSSLFKSNVLTGKIYVGEFFFTRCGTICPKLTASMSRIQDIFIKNGNVSFVSFSVDPNHDRPNVLRNYIVKKLKNRPKNWYFLTGTKEDIYSLILKGYFLPVDDASVYNKKLSIDDTFIHSERLVMVDHKGHIRGYYDGTDSKEVDRLIAEIRIILDNQKNE